MSKAFTSRVKRWGGSKALTIPPQIVDALGINEGDLMALRKHGEQIIVERVALEDLARKTSAPAEVRTA